MTFRPRSALRRAAPGAILKPRGVNPIFDDAMLLAKSRKAVEKRPRLTPLKHRKRYMSARAKLDSYLAPLGKSTLHFVVTGWAFFRAVGAGF
jgi:hypothetical protein